MKIENFKKNIAPYFKIIKKGEDENQTCRNITSTFLKQNISPSVDQCDLVCEGGKTKQTFVHNQSQNSGQTKPGFHDSLQQGEHSDWREGSGTEISGPMGELGTDHTRGEGTNGPMGMPIGMGQQRTLHNSPVVQ